MKALKKVRTQQGQPARQLSRGAQNALRVLEICPFVPVDAFVHLAGLGAYSSAYQQLARLRRAGLAKVCRVDPGYLVGERRLGCWTITEEGRRALCAAGGLKTSGQAVVRHRKHGARSRQEQWRIAARDASLLIASYRLLASLVLDRGAGGEVIEVQQWEWPWVREAWSPASAKLLRVRMPAGAVLRVREAASNPDSPTKSLMTVVLVPDLGTTPVLRYREVLRRLVALREEVGFGVGSADTEPEIIIGTPDPDRTGARSRAWLQLIDRVVRRQGEHPLRVRLLTWDWITEMLRSVPYPDLAGDDRERSRGHENGGVGMVQWTAPARSREQLLHLIGRHPLLTVDQLARLLGTAVERIRRLQNELIQDGMIRRIDFDELPRVGTIPTHEEFSALGLVEITITGKRRVAAWLGLSPGPAARYHGLTGYARSNTGRRWQLLRTLAHTVGANGVFTAFAVAAEAVRQAGGDDALAEWRSGAACERRRCKPDGYGCYIRNGVAHGFFLEYDRGTERGRKYAAKFGAYYRYRDSGQAARDFNGFPTLLFVTTQPAAEQRIADEAYRAWFIRGTEPVNTLISTVDRIYSNQRGVLGRIWRRVPVIGSPLHADLEYWPTEGRQYSSLNVPESSKRELSDATSPVHDDSIGGRINCAE